jgi:hypothetical protein
VTYAEVLGARVERGRAELDIPAPLVDGASAGGDLRLVADRDHAVLHVESVADFAISEGRCVRVDPHRGARPADVDAYLRGAVAVVLLGQRRRFALHASFIRVGETVVAVAAAQGTGKSTTALRLEQRGHEFVCDDVAELRPEADAVAYTTFGRAAHVVPETATVLGIDTADALGTSRKGKLALRAQPVTSGRLDAVAVLSRGDVARVATQRLTGGRALANVFAHTFRLSTVKLLWPTEAFSWAGAVTARLPVYAVTRPHEAWTVDAVADAVETIAAETRGAAASPL